MKRTLQMIPVLLNLKDWFCALREKRAIVMFTMCPDLFVVSKPLWPLGLRISLLQFLICKWRWEYFFTQQKKCEVFKDRWNYYGTERAEILWGAWCKGLLNWHHMTVKTWGEWGNVDQWRVLDTQLLKSLVSLSWLLWKGKGVKELWFGKTIHGGCQLFSRGQISNVLWPRLVADWNGRSYVSMTTV